MVMIFILGLLLGAVIGATLAAHFKLKERLDSGYVSYAEIWHSDSWHTRLKSRNHTTLWYAHGHNRKENAIKNVHKTAGNVEIRER